MSELKQKILAKLNVPNLAVLATITEDGKPWARYVMPFADQNLTLWMATRLNTRKVGQIKKNPEVHVTAGCVDPQAGEPFLQIQGKAEVLTDAETRHRVWFDHLKAIFTGPDDPNFGVVKITPYRIEYQPMGPGPADVWEP